MPRGCRACSSPSNPLREIASTGGDFGMDGEGAGAGQAASVGEVAWCMDRAVVLRRRVT